MEDILISLKSYLTSDGKYPDREHSLELNSDLLRNANALLKAVNALLNDLKVSPAVSSGFRTTASNASIGGSRKSNHCKCLAIDLVDKDKKLKELVGANITLLEKYGLYVEDFASTPTWLHIQLISPASGKRFFKP